MQEQVPEPARVQQAAECRRAPALAYARAPGVTRAPAITAAGSRSLGCPRGGQAPIAGPLRIVLAPTIVIRNTVRPHVGVDGLTAPRPAFVVAYAEAASASRVLSADDGYRFVPETHT